MKKTEVLDIEDMKVYTLTGREYTNRYKNKYLEVKRSWWQVPKFLLSSHCFLLEIHGENTEYCNTAIYDTKNKCTCKLTGRWCTSILRGTLYLEVKYNWWRKPVFINEENLAEIYEND